MPPQRHETQQNIVVIPEVEGVIYTGSQIFPNVTVPEEGLTLGAEPDEGFEFPEGVETSWYFEYISDNGDDEPPGDTE